MRTSSSAVREDGFSDLGASLDATLAKVGMPEIVDLLGAGMTAEDLVRVVATTPPFSSALSEHIKDHLLAVIGSR